jgi:hypothetical protein
MPAIPEGEVDDTCLKSITSTLEIISNYYTVLQDRKCTTTAMRGSLRLNSAPVREDNAMGSKNLRNRAAKLIRSGYNSQQ